MPTSNHFWHWLRERLFPRGTNLIQWAAYVVVVAILIDFVLQPPAATTFGFNSAVFALAVLLVLNIVWEDLKARFSNEQTGEWVLLLASAALTFYVIAAGNFFNALYILFMIIARANVSARPAPALAFSILLNGGFVGLVMANDPNPEQLSSLFVSLLVALTFTVTFSQVLRLYIEQSEKMKLLLQELQQANAELIEAREKEKELAIAEERVRMARDLHDGLGHHLTALSIQLQAAEKMVRSNPEMAAGSVRSARGEVQAALKEVRQSVAALRETPVDIRHLAQAIAALVEETGQRSGLQGSFVQEGEPADLSPAAAMTLFRAVQEGLTNVQKHAIGAQAVCVRLVYTPDGVRLVIDDDGQPTLDAGEQTGGFGLAGLRERASLLGGSLECGPRTGSGFRVEIHLPAEVEARP